MYIVIYQYMECYRIVQDKDLETARQVCEMTLREDVISKYGYDWPRGRKAEVIILTEDDIS